MANSLLKGTLTTKSGSVTIAGKNINERDGTDKAPYYSKVLQTISNKNSSMVIQVSEISYFVSSDTRDKGSVYISVSGDLYNYLKKKNINVKGGWFKLTSGNVSFKGSTVKSTRQSEMKTTAKSEAYDATSTTTTTTTEDVAGTVVETTYSGAGLDSDVSVEDYLGDLMSDSINGIFGVPYQWTATVDRRLPKSTTTTTTCNFGRKYSEKIAARMPLVFLTPGKPSFMPGADKESKNNIISELTALAIGSKDKISSALDELLDASNTGAKKFYSLNFAYEPYYRYVNPMCQIVAKYMGLTGTYKYKIGKKSSVKFTEFDWSQALTNNFTKYWSSASAIPFYMDAASSVNDSFSNDTTQSSLASSVSDLSSKAKEFQFLLGTGTSALDSTGGNLADKGLGLTADAVNKFREYLSGLTTSKSGSSTMANIGSSIVAIAQGGSMLFPEIWDSSSLGRSYSISIKLRSPDCDNLSLYLNIMVPFIHLLCLVAPQMIGNNINTYGSPFLVRAYCKSMFNIDMGIITSMDVSRGGEGKWNSNGVPTEMDITLNIKDLYETFSITGWNDTSPITSIFRKATNSPLQIIKNTAMMDYLGNLSGLNLNYPEVTRNISTYFMLTSSNVKNWPNRQWMKLQQAVDNRLRNLYKPGSV